MKQYELMFIVPGTLTEAEVTPEVALVEEVLTAAGTTEMTTTSLGKAKLAYPMKHIRYGYFYSVAFSIDGSAVSALQNKLNLQKTLLRAIINLATPEGHTRDNTPEGLITIEKKQDLIDERKKAVARYKEEQSNNASATPVAAPKAVVVEAPKVATEETAEEPATEEAPKEAVNMDDIDKKLDDIVSGDDIASGV